MAVKSSTKKRLIELGVTEEHAHKLADDANMDAIKRMTVEEVAKKVGLESGASELENIMGIIREQAASRRRSRSGRITISRTALLDEDIPIGEDRFNVLNHQLVPHHSLVPEEDEASELSPWGLMEKGDNGEDRLAKELLPKILITDPSVQALKEMEEADRADLPAGWLKNRVVKIYRYSRSAGASTAYRLIVESN
ncbi:MAG: DNA-directed RNA polymerase subunit RpoH/Rpb5 C-terminal domain-containing protein [Candidatus Thermoplasmatota archaeon]|nr:DNA-directed RNA polymerase subunit RpoH/Rpb5 C-terminal domain-containing protein [Candidatus Thermoplasmatota archaeon]MEC9146700.1 DNA-directed RNA polymerase subunit RpoH/Rpb5 C-terminal domain-containing protein [Candidatus Thermoplasmatota archaeon]